MRGLGPWLLALGGALLATGAGGQARIENTATLRFVAGDGMAGAVASNTVALTVARARLPSRISLRALPAGIDPAGARCTAGSPPLLAAAPLTPSQVSGAAPRSSFEPDAGAVVVIDAPGSNRDPLRRETVAMMLATDGGRSVAVTLSETDPDSGVFAGAIPPPGPPPGVDALAPCEPAFARGERATLSFGGDDGSLPSTYAALVDPAGIVFDSTDGSPVSGAEVTLVDESGRPATVYGDDGASAYPATVTSGSAVADATGRVYPVAPGGYRFPLVAAGRYRLRIVPPAGYAAPSTASPEALAALRDGAGRPFILDAASTGGTLVVAGTDPVMTDIPLDRRDASALVLSVTASVRDATPGDPVEFRLRLANRGTRPSGPVRLTGALPPGLRVRAGTLRGATLRDRGDGRTLDVDLPSLDAGRGADISYLAVVAPAAPRGEATTSWQARAPAMASNIASASVRLKPLLLTDSITILGRVTAGDCALPARERRGVGGARILLDDGSIAITDRDGYYHLEGITPGRHVVALDAAALPGLAPIDCAADTRSAGSATSRFVEGAGGLPRRVDFFVRRSATPAALPVASPVVALSDAEAAGDRDWLAGQAPGVAWLFPAPDHNPRAPVTRVAILHAPDQRVALFIEGRAVDPLAFDATDSDGQRGVAVSRWVGIPLAPGANHLAARILAADGHVVTTLERTVTVSGAPRSAVVDAAHSRLAADGLTPPLVAVRVTDADGRPVRAGTAIRYAVAAPYLAAEDAALAQRRQAAGAPATAQVIGDDGLALLALQPTGQAGAARVTVLLDDGGQAPRAVPLEAWLTPAARGWTVIGFAAGTIGHDLLADHARQLPAGGRNRRVASGEVSLYAKGRIKGSWLLTLAVDSARRLDPDRGLLGLFDPARYYTVYGDTAVQGIDAASRRRLYLRLETPAFFALFGDARTGMVDARLTRYDRVVSGVTAGYRRGGWRASGFAARPDTLAGRDEIQGNGLTGPYRLRAQHIVLNTDRLRIEVRDRLRSEVILSTTPLVRHLDYTIDAAAGTIRFASPVASRDAAGNPVIVVAEYEVEGGRAAQVAGGRVARRFGAVEVGVAGIADDTLGRGRLVGGDVAVRIDAATVARGEIAVGGWRGLGSGRAWLGEIEHRGARLDAVVYAREQAVDFGLGQQSLTESGTRKIGGDLRWRLGDGLVVSAAGWHQRLLGRDGERIAGEARVDWTRGLTTLFAGAQVARDTGLDGGERRSQLLTLGARRVLAGGALTLEGRADVALGAASSLDFPARRQVTAAWRLSPGVRVIGGYEIDQGRDFTARTVRAGVELTPWRGGTLSAALGGQGAGDAGARRYVQYGFGQSVALGARWSLDATLDSARTLSGAIAARAMVSPFQPVAAAGALGRDAGDFAAATLGLGYRDARWSARGRLEYRDGALDTRWGVTLDALRAIGEGRTLVAGWRSYRVTDRAGVTAASHAGDVALALRPAASGWSLLDRLSFRNEHGDPQASAAGGTTLGTSVIAAGPGQVTTRLVNNVALDWRSTPDGRGRGIEVSLYYGIKYVRGRYGDDLAAGLVDATAVEIRRSLGHRVDIGVAASVEHGWTDRVWAWSAGPSVGVSPAGDLWISAGYNVRGYRDRDFASERYTRSGPYLTLRAKFDARRLGALFGRRP